MQGLAKLHRPRVGGGSERVETSRASGSSSSAPCRSELAGRCSALLEVNRRSTGAFRAYMDIEKNCPHGELFWKRFPTSIQCIV